MRIRRQNRGFSAVEVLVAAIIIALVGIAAMKFLQNFQKANRTMASNLEADADLQTAVGMLKFHWRYRLFPDAGAYSARPSVVGGTPACTGLNITQRTAAGGTRAIAMFTRCRAAPVPNPGPAQVIRNIGCIPEFVITDGPTMIVFPGPGGGTEIGMAVCFDFPAGRVTAIGQVLVRNGNTSTSLATRAYASVNDRPPNVEFLRQ